MNALPNEVARVVEEDTVKEEAKFTGHYYYSTRYGAERSHIMNIIRPAPKGKEYRPVTLIVPS